jgi:predicted outer membrane repeat protein
MKQATLVFLFGLLALGLSGQTVIPGGAVSGVLAFADSPFLIQSDIFVDTGSTLVIEPGVILNFEPFSHLQVYGCLRAAGTPGDSITFRAYGEEGWGGIIIDGMDWSVDSTRFAHAIITGSTETGISLYSATRVAIQHCRVSENFGINAGGLYATDTTPVITDNLFANNRSSSFGGGMNFWGPNFPYLARNRIVNNTAEVNAGGGICVYSGHPTMIGNVIQRNRSLGSAGGGIYFHNSVIHMTGNTVINNSAADFGGGICCWSGCAPQIVNNLIANNSAVYGGGFFSYVCSLPFLTNCTIVNNAATYGGGVYLSDRAEAQLTNDILWGNEASEGPEAYFETLMSDAYVRYCDVAGGIEGFGNAGDYDAAHYQNCVEGDPLFMNPSTGAGMEYSTACYDWMIDNASACINLGDPSTIDLQLPTYDLMGHMRVLSGRIDIGAFEYFFQGTGATDQSTIVRNGLTNYPNPFNPHTTFSYSIERSGAVSLEVFNLRGQKVRSLVAEHQSAGSHSAIWNGADEAGSPVGSGVYFCRLTADGHQSVKPISLLK